MKNLSGLLASVFVLAGLPMTGLAKVDFSKEIAPILQKSCLECHGESKQKGDLRLDSKEAAFKGGKGGVAIVPGEADKSDLYKRIILPKGHDDVMPPKGEPLPKAQTDLIKQWITEGAQWPAGFALKAAGEATASAEAPVKRADHKPSPAELKAVAALEAAGVSVRPIAQNVNWREASFRSLGTNATDASIAPLKDVLGLVDLNLASTRVTDAGLVVLKGLTNLSVLHLENTGISDAGLVHLKELRNLEYLNLFNTQVTDAGLKHLEGLQGLKNVYLWQTKVTDAGLAALRKALPNAKVHTGWDLNAVAKQEEKPAEKK